MKKRNVFVPSDISPSDIPYLLRHCAEQLFAQAKVSTCGHLLEDLCPTQDYRSFFVTHPELFLQTYEYHEGRDTLGLLYQSLCDIKSRKHSGSFYTPASVTEKLITQHLPTDAASTYFDPSCGTGIFLLQLPSSVPLHHLYGNDLNPLCVTLTRINLALKYHVATKEELDILYRNITVSDYLTYTGKQFDVILGNPPWGAALSEKQKQDYRNRFSCAPKKGTEVFDLFIEQSISLLSPDGILSFVLPEAVLTVKMHQPVRALLGKSCTALSVEYLGDVFRDVYCPSIIFTLKKTDTPVFYQNTKVSRAHHTHIIKERPLPADFTAFSFSLSDEEYALLHKIRQTPNCVTLKGNASFALGIVTGNNDALLTDSPAEGFEPVIKGKDISKYHIDSYSGYLRFCPESFNQTAPEHLYRAKEKLFYRFINRQLIFAYDTTGLLSLNSCNIVIPQFDGLSVKYVMAILNSSVARFIFEKQFASVKVLRSHLEAIPIPVADNLLHDRIVSMVDILLREEKESRKYQTTFSALDQLIFEIFGLNEEECSMLSRG